MRRIINLHKKYQTDVACILEHGTNFSMLPEGKCAGNLFGRITGSRVSTAHNINESISQCQQGGTLVAAFSQLAGFVQEMGVDRTGLGRWSRIKVGTGKHSTQIVSANQPRNSTTARTRTLDPSGKMKRSQTVCAQHVCYFQKKGIFHDPRKAFRCQLITQLKHWRAKGDKIILFADLNEDVYTGQLAKLLQGNDLLMSKQTLQSTGAKAPFSNGCGKATIIGTFATLGIVCANSYLSPQKEGVGDHWFQVHGFDASSVLGTNYPKSIQPSGRALRCVVERTVKKYNKVLRQMLIQHRAFKKIKYLQVNHGTLTSAEFQSMFNVWDKEVTQLMLGSEKRCNKFRDGNRVQSGGGSLDTLSPSIQVD